MEKLVPEMIIVCLEVIAVCIVMIVDCEVMVDIGQGLSACLPAKTIPIKINPNPNPINDLKMSY
jgi:hypothetical protein